MDVILTSNLSKNMKNRLREKLNILECCLNEDCLNSLKEDTKINYIEKDNDIISFCIYSKINKLELHDDLDATCFNYEKDAYEYYENYINNLDDDMIYIYYMESLETEQGYGQKILNSIFDLDKDIILMSRIESEKFWEKNGFINIFGVEYAYHRDEL